MKLDKLYKDLVNGANIDSEALKAAGAEDGNMYKCTCALGYIIISALADSKEESTFVSNLSGAKILFFEDSLNIKDRAVNEYILNKYSGHYEVIHGDSDENIEKVLLSYYKVLNIDISECDIDSELLFYIENDVRQIMSVYDVVYKPLFEMEPVGILTSEGVIYVGSDYTIKKREAIGGVARTTYRNINSQFNNVIKELKYDEKINISNCINNNGSLKVNYIPGFHVKKIFGICRKMGKQHRERNWLDFRKYIEADLTNSLTEIIGSFKGSEDSRELLVKNVVELFTTIFVAEEFDNKSCKLTSKSIAIGNKLNELGKFITSGKIFTAFDATQLKLIDNSEIANGVYGTLTIFDVAAYNGEILFAYKAIQKILESGGNIDLQRTLLGKDVRGRNVTFNFADKSNIISLILAGSGSGKGVMTLNILATFIACGCPTVYVDWKPDMSAMLWELERSTGARILAIDGAVGVKGKIVPVRDFKTGVNAPNIENITDKLNVIPYLKMLQLTSLCATARNMRYNGMSNEGMKMQFIFDEAEQMNRAIKGLQGALERYKQKYKPKTGAPVTSDYEYVDQILNFMDGLSEGLSDIRDTQGRQGNVGLIIIGQHAATSDWSDGQMKRDIMGSLIGNASMKLLGRGATDSTKYSLGDAEPVGRELLGNMGYYALINGGLANKKMNIPVIKSYLILNDNDYNPTKPGPFTGDLLKNITDNNIKQHIIEDELFIDGKVNERIGFRGLMEYMGSKIKGFDLNKNLELGYIEIEKLLNGLGILGTGRFDNVEAYIFDLAPDAIFTTSYLKSLIKSGDKVHFDNVVDTEGGTFNNINIDETEVPEDSYYCQTCGYKASEPISMPCPNCNGNPLLSDGTWTCSNCGKSPISNALDTCTYCGALKSVATDDSGYEKLSDYDDTDESDNGTPDNSGYEEQSDYDNTDVSDDGIPEDYSDTYDGFGDTGDAGSEEIPSPTQPPVPTPVPAPTPTPVPNSTQMPTPNPTQTSMPTPFSHTEATTYEDTPDNSYTPEYDADILFKDDGKYHPFSGNAMERTMSNNIVEIIKEYFGDLRLVNTISIENGGHILVNGIHINPTFNVDASSNNIPPYIVNRLGSGQWGEFLHGKDLLKFTNLSVLKIDGMNLVNKYCRELGVSDAFKLKAKIQRKTKLMEFYIDGRLVEETEREYIEDADRGSNFSEGVKNALGGIAGVGSALASACSTIHNSKIWNSGVGRFAKGVAAVGGVAVALPLLSGIITGLGFFGTLNLAIACAGGVYNVVRKRKSDNTGSRGSSFNNTGSSSSSGNGRRGKTK